MQSALLANDVEKVHNDLHGFNAGLFFIAWYRAALWGYVQVIPGCYHGSPRLGERDHLGEDCAQFRP